MRAITKQNMDKNFSATRSGPRWARLAVLTILGAFSLTGCGRQEFVPVSSAAGQQSPGFFNIPARVDILLAQDDTGSIYEANGINSQLSNFLTGIQAQGWDYHFATTPLAHPRAMDQVIGSQYDTNWGSNWLAPYPGASRPAPGTMGMIVPQFFRTPDNYTGLIAASQITNSDNGTEPGLATILDALDSRATGTGFLRDDAMLVIFVVGNGNDNSGVIYSSQSGGLVVPSGTQQNCVTKEGQTGQACTEAFYQSEMRKLRPNPKQIQFHAAVAAQAYSNGGCQGGNSWIGTRYVNMVGAIGGSHYDVCTTPIATIFDKLAASLQAQKVAYARHYLFISADPDLASLHVYRYVNGDSSQSQEIPQDATNGWTYAGYQTNVYAIDEPFPMSLTTGYAIELHGTAKIRGNDQANVVFKPSGLTISH